MPKSEAFIRIRTQVLAISATIPRGKVCTYQSIGAHLDVMPRHVAYILAQLDPASKMVHPWHRVVSGDGTLGVPKRAPTGQTQAELLAAEGVAVVGNAVAPTLEHYFVAAGALPHGLPPQVRPATGASTGAGRAPRRGKKSG
jgi:methylated-DNA-protein-cysteine methyltransferase-like protein